MGKIVSILLALALVVSVGLVTGVPVLAAVSQPQVTVSPVRANITAEYTFVFGITATLSVGDSITVEFPDDTAVPGSYDDGAITINAHNVSHGDITVVGRNVTMVTSNAIGAPATVTVVFTAAANITNPTTTDDYKLKVNTSKETTPVESVAYAIREVPAVTTVKPGGGNVGDTMWVEITGTSFMGDEDTNASDTTISFGVGADVLQTKYISVTEIDVQIEVKAMGTFSVTAQTPAGNSTTNGNFAAHVAGTKRVDVWQKYTPSDGTFTANTLVFGATYITISAAVASAGVDYTLLVHSGVYEEDLVISAAKEGVTLMSVSGKDATTIKGVQNGLCTDWPTAYPNIDILADGIRLTGFTIASPDYQADHYTSGMLIGGSNVEIYENDFEVTSAEITDEISQAITTYHENAIPGVNLTGLNIHDNNFAPLVSNSTAGYEGIYINYSVATAGVTIADNTFGGEIVRAITTECSDTVISGNTIITDLAPGLPGGYMGILVCDYFLAAQDSVSVIGNTVKGSASGKGFQKGIVIGKTGQTLTNISVTRNTVQDNETGILVRSSAGGVVVNYNNVAGNTQLGLNNTDSVKLDALYNWWGHAIGPHDDTRNPGGQQNAVTGNVTFSPWLYKPQEQFAHDAPCLAGSVVLDNEAEEIQPGSYAGGWNSFSTPVALDGSANTVSELLALAAASDLFILRAQRFDLATQEWVPVILNNVKYGTTDYQIKPGEGFYIQVRSKGSLPILVATTTTAPPMRDLAPGWNLIGLSSFQEKTVAIALTGVSYSMVLSPKPPNDVAWSVPPDPDTAHELLLGQAYWVAMGEPGILFGFTYTPVADDMTWDLNQ
jgi:hypothetical protein